MTRGLEDALKLKSTGRLSEAERVLRAVLARDPRNLGASFVLGELLLSLGRYAEGWPLLDVRAQLSPGLIPPVTNSYPEWKGEPLAGKSILVWVEQGHGDQIMFGRFVPMMRAQGGRVTLACRAPLVPLLAPLADEVISITPNGSYEVQRHDYWSRYFSLPQHLGITVDNLPSTPYLSTPADRLPNRPRRGGIGLMWETSATGLTNKNKCIPTDLVQPWLRQGFTSLRPEDTGAADFGDTAAIIAGLDLVISVDTAVAHLAGAMGKPCWTLLPHSGVDWRWLRNRPDSPWYPTMRLFRQAQPGGWGDVIGEVDRALEAGQSGQGALG